MMLESFFELAPVLLTIITPLVAVPLTMITFYLRSLREHQATGLTELGRRVDLVQGSAERLQRTQAEFERDYTTKEEWLRETMWARRNLEVLRDTAVRLEARLGASECGLATNDRRTACDFGDIPVHQPALDGGD